jgi:hypothetical protein
VRTLIAAAAALLAVGTATPSFAAPFPPTIAGSASIVQSLSSSLTTVHLTKKKKKKSKSKSKESASFEEIGNAKRGKSDLAIKVKVSKADRTCQLKITWNNDDTSEDEQEADDSKICEFSVEVPGDRGVVGDATATVTVKDSSGKKVATAKETFTVK